MRLVLSWRGLSGFAGFAGLVGFIVLAGLAGCAGEADSSADAAENSGRSQAATPSATPDAGAPSSPTSDSPTPTQTTAEVPEDLTLIEVSVSNGVLSSDLGQVAVPLGNTVRLVVTADIADEIHVHGYDLDLALAPGVPGQLEFVAEIPGIFEVELHEGGQLLCELRVE